MSKIDRAFKHYLENVFDAYSVSDLKIIRKKLKKEHDKIGVKIVSKTIKKKRKDSSSEGLLFFLVSLLNDKYRK